MNNLYIIPIVTLVLLGGLLVFGFYNSSDTATYNENSFFTNTGNSESQYQIVEVGGYQF